jgi:hypothetical protein
MAEERETELTEQELADEDAGFDEGAAEGEAEPSPDEAAPSEEKEVEQPSVAKRLEQRTASYVPPPETPAPGPTRMSREQVAEYLSMIPDDELPEGEIIIGNQAVNLKELAEEDPDTYAAMKVMAGAIAAKGIERATRAMGEQVSRVAYWMHLHQEHPDALKVAKSADFATWLQGQPRGIQHLSVSPDPADGALVLDYYKEEQAKKTRKKAATSSQPRKATVPNARLTKLEMDDEEAGWREGGRRR